MTYRLTVLPLTLATLVSVAAGGCRGGGASASDARGSGQATVAAAPATSGAFAVRDATLSLPTPAMGAAYFVVQNPGSAPDRLLGVSSGQAERAELHETVDDDGVMRMVPRPEGLEVPAGGLLELAPGGAHVMLVNPAPEDGVIELTLTFEAHEPIVLRLTTQPTPDGAAEASDPHHSDHADPSGHHERMAHGNDGGQGS